MRRWSATALSGTIALTLSAAAPATMALDDTALASAVDALFVDDIDGSSPGAVVGIYQAGKTRLLRTYGMADLEQHRSVRPDTVFHVASVSKQFTAYAIALLASEGKLDLDADIRQYLPWMPQTAGEHPRILVRDLVHHTSGLRDQWSLFAIGGRESRDLLDQQQILSMLRRQQALNFAPGQEYEYSNSNYTLLAEIVQTVSGQSLREFLQQRVFAPLGMSRSLFYDDVTELLPDRANAYTPRRGGSWARTPLNYNTVGATSLMTTAEDMALWAANFANPRVGDEALVSRITTLGQLRDGHIINYAFGLRELVIGGHLAYGHSGRDAGYNAFFAWFPDADLALFIATNFTTNLRDEIEGIVQLYLGAGSLDAAWPEPLQEPDRRRAKQLRGNYLRENHWRLSLDVAADGELQMDSTLVRPVPLTQWDDGSIGYGPHYREHFRPIEDAGGNVIAIERISPRDRARERFERVERHPHEPRALKGLEGRYRSEELDIEYGLRVDGSHLELTSIWSPTPVRYRPVAKDRFEAADWHMGLLRIERCAHGEPIAFYLSGGRVRNLRFTANHSSGHSHSKDSKPQHGRRPHHHGTRRAHHEQAACQPSPGPVDAVLHRDVGAVLLLRDAGHPGAGDGPGGRGAQSRPGAER